MSCLKLLPLDSIKINKTFLSNLPASANDTAISSTIIYIAHRLALKIIVKGAETEQQADLLKADSYGFALGYLIAPPLPAMQITDFLQQLNDQE